MYQGKCHFCDVCDGRGCLSELPGMGGVFENENFMRNCADWAQYAAASEATTGPLAAGIGDFTLPRIRLAPITGAIQNVGYHDEKTFYFDLINGAIAAEVGLSIGDGHPDEKLLFGIDALASAGRAGAVFIKPYENRKIIERMEWASSVSEIIGVDIDSYAILTMRNLVNLQKKGVSDLLEIKARAASEGKPFAIKGIFRPEDLELVREVRPDIVVVSNHGGRVETLRGSSADFLARHGSDLASFAGEVWVDGGIRTRADVEAAGRLGAKEVMIGRPFITALLRSGAEGLRERVGSLAGVSVLA